MIFSDLSDDELLDQLDFLRLELSCIMGHEEYESVEKVFWEVVDEINRRELVLDEEGNKEERMVEGYRKDEDDFKDCFGGREEGDDGLDLPF